MGDFAAMNEVRRAVSIARPRPERVAERRPA
jgi:hypothetical protein